MKDYIQKLDEIDKWLYESFGIVPGACSSIENLRHDTARMVAEALWPHALTIKDVEKLHTFLYAVKNNKQGVFTFTRLTDEQYAEVIRRFLKSKKKEKVI